MERRIAGIMKWLERCLKACRTGALESALMDVECARADMERLRDEVWTKLERRHAAKTRVRWSLFSVKLAFWALTAVLFAATPIALPRERAARETEERREAVTLEWVTPDEKMLLSNLRKHLSDSNALASVAPPLQPMEELVPPLRQAVKSPAKRPEARVRLNPVLPVLDTGGGEKESIPYDRIVSLVQAGERALKNEPPAIMVEK